MTTVYLVRHSEGFKPMLGEINTSDSLQLINEKTPLSYDGEIIAKTMADHDEFKNIDAVWSSSYVRAIETAKYFAHNNNLLVNVDDRLGERVQGINDWNELPSDFGERQFIDDTYKVGFGENQIEVRKRMEEVFFEILNKNKNKRIVIVSHSTAMAFLLMRWCKVFYSDSYLFNDKEFFDGKWKFCETFKLDFDDDNNLIDINNIRYD